MSTKTASYVKSLNNPAWLVTLIQNSVTTNTLNFYNYDVPTTTLTLTFRQNLDTSTKQIVDTLVLNYNETQALSLSLADQTAFKFAQFTSTVDQALSTTPTDIRFQSETYVDRQYYMSSTKSFLYIQKPGTYLVLARLTSYVSGSFVDTSCVQYDLFYDDTRTEQGFLNYPLTTVYTTHRNVWNGQETTILACVFLCNPAQGSYVKVQGKIISGSTPISIKGDYTTVQFMNIPNASYFESVLTTSFTLPTAFGNVFLGKDRIVNYPFNHTVGQASITISNSGWLFLIAKATFTKSSGVDNSQAALRFYSLGQFAFMAGTAGYSTEIVAGSKSTANYTGLIPVNAGTTITYQVQQTQGSSMALSPNETGVVAVFLNASLYPQISLLNSFTDIVQNNGPFLYDNLYNDLTFTTLRTLQPPSPNNTIIFSTNTPEIIVNDTGVFTISAHVSVYNPSNNSGQLTVSLSSSVDGGKSYYSIIGSKSSRSIGRQDKTSVTTTSIVPISSGHRIKVQSAATNASGDVIQYADSCTVSLLKFSTATLTSAQTLGQTTFGTNFHVVISKESMQMNSTSMVEKCRLTTGYLPSAVYRVASRCAITIPDSEVVTYELLSSPPSGQTTTISSKVVYTSNPSLGTTDYMFLSEGVHTFIMQMSTKLGLTITASGALIELWRT